MEITKEIKQAALPILKAMEAVAESKLRVGFVCPKTLLDPKKLAEKIVLLGIIKATVKSLETDSIG